MLLKALICQHSRLNCPLLLSVKCTILPISLSRNTETHWQCAVLEQNSLIFLLGYLFMVYSACAHTKRKICHFLLASLSTAPVVSVLNIHCSWHGRKKVAYGSVMLFFTSRVYNMPCLHHAQHHLSCC